MTFNLKSAILRIVNVTNDRITGNQLKLLLEQAEIANLENLERTLDELLDSQQLSGERIATVHGPRYLISRRKDLAVNTNGSGAQNNINISGMVIGSVTQNATTEAARFPREDLERVVAGTSDEEIVRQLSDELQKSQPSPSVVITAIDRLSKVAGIVEDCEPFIRWLNNDSVQTMISTFQSMMP